ncbi:MAG: hypothetical protein ACREJD_07120 [Phycisphaerales bacterium]
MVRTLGLAIAFMTRVWPDAESAAVRLGRRNGFRAADAVRNDELKLIAQVNRVIQVIQVIHGLAHSQEHGALRVYVELKLQRKTISGCAHKSIRFRCGSQ